MMRTVLPTPAPPKSPTFPPREYGAMRSTTLMPVSRIWVDVSCSSNFGAARWIGHTSLLPTGSGLWSTVSPRTLKTRPRVASPTGTLIGAPVSSASMPRIRPSVELMAIQRVTLSPRCCMTSTVRSMSWSAVLPLTLMAFRISGSSPAGNSISTTGPMTCTTLPFANGKPPYLHARGVHGCHLSASAPPTISLISFVMPA